MRLQTLLLAVLGHLVLAGKHYRDNKRESNSCMFREPNFSYEFNFSELSDNKDDYEIKHDEGVVLRVQPCGPLKNACHGDGDYSVCLSRQGQEIGIGKVEPKIDFEFGNIIFKYTGDNCKENRTYTMNIKMICDLTVTDGSGTALFANGYKDCNFNMDWRTKAACAPKTQINCTLDHESGHYDLSQLTNLSNNYKIPIDKKHYVILNVCHSVLYGPNTCKSNNAACLVETSGKSKNLGIPKDNLRYNSDGTLSITYKEGYPCDYQTPDAPPATQTTIIFICDLNAIETLPQYAGGMEQCNYKFTWRTASACSEQALHKKSLENIHDSVCAVRNPETNQLYNLTSLMNREYQVHPFGLIDAIHKYSICGPLVNSSCIKGSGVCKLHKNLSSGIANSNLMWKESGPYLNYTDGHACLGQLRYTVIEFYCGQTDSAIENNGCFDTIKISTELVCSGKKNTCSSYNNEINLEQLILQNSNYMTRTNDAVYYINICRPLVQEENLGCPPGVAICKATVVDDKLTNPISLGYPDGSPVFSGQAAVLIYRNGSICEEDKTRLVESSISFLCDVNTEVMNSQPKFVKYKDCTYSFEWNVNIVCGKTDGTVHGNWSVSNKFGDFRDLSVLSEDIGPVYDVMNEKEDRTYKISLNGDRKVCNGAFICDNKMNYGTKVSVLFDYSANSVQLSFKEGTQCNKDGSLAHSSLTMICKEPIFKSEPTLLWEQPCHVHFEWYTNKICKSHSIIRKTFTSTEIVPSAKSIPDEIGSLSGGSKAVIIGVICIVLIAICYLQDASRRLRLIELITDSTSRSRDRVKYSRVNTVEEVHLLLDASDPTGIETDTDDDLLGV